MGIRDRSESVAWFASMFRRYSPARSWRTRNPCTMAASWAVASAVCRRLCAPGADQSDHQPGRSTMALASILLDRIDDDPLAVPLALPDLAIDRVGIR